MKTIFPGYNKKNENEIKLIWDNCVIVFDTNVLLNLYRYSDSTRETMIQLITKFSDRIWLPHQAALEYNINRYEVIADQERTYKDFIDKIKQIQKDLQSNSKPPFLSNSLHKELDQSFEKVNKEVDETITKYNNFLKEDPIYEKICNLFESRTGHAFKQEELKEIYEKGKERYKLKIPPGYEDEKTKEGDKVYGDLVLWKQILKKAGAEKKPIILITDERKTDWWWKIKDGRNMGPRQELVEEIMKETGMDFHMYSSERFLSYGQSYLDQKVNKKALEELQALKEYELDLIDQINIAEESYYQWSHHLVEDRKFLYKELRRMSDAINDIDSNMNNLAINTDNKEKKESLLNYLAEEKKKLTQYNEDLKQKLIDLNMKTYTNSNYFYRIPSSRIIRKKKQ